MEDTLTPTPQGASVTETMSFYDALKKIAEGKSVTRISWGNTDYCLMKDSWLSIFRNGKFSTWLINDGDMEGNDWIVKKDLN
jgi:hypothetical protein